MTDPKLPPATNESYEIKRVQMEAAACVAAFMHQLGAKYAPRHKNAWSPGVYSQFIRSDRWRKDAQVIDFHHDSHDHRKSEFVAFSDVFYGPESDFIEGTPKILQNATLNVDGLTKIFDNSQGGDPLHIAYTEAVTLANSVSVGVKNAFTFDTTTESETTVSGSYAGASLEEKLTETVHVGLAREDSKDTEESKAVETGVAVEFDCPAGAIKQVHINKDHKRELIPVSGLFVVDFKVTFQLYHWWNHDAGGIKYRNESQDTFSADSVQGLYELMRGVDTNYPHLAGFWQDGNANQSEVHNGILHLLDYRNRSYSLDLDKTRVIENNENYKVTDLESLSHGKGEVVNLSDEENVDRYTR